MNSLFSSSPTLNKILSISLSLLLHVFTFLIFEIWPNQLPEFKNLRAFSNKPFTIKEIKTEKQEKLRRAGIKESEKKDTVFIPKEQGRKKPGKGHKDATLSLEQLGVSLAQTEEPNPKKKKQQQKEKSNKKKKQERKLEIQKAPQIKVPRFNPETVADQQQMKEKLLRQMGQPQTGTGKELTKRGETFIKFDPPKGLPLDELNTLEKMLYSFQVRVYKNYLRSLILSYSELSPYRPNLNQDLRNDSYRLTGRVTFDAAGNVTAIKILDWTQNNNVQDLFEKALKKIDKIPNPPKKLMGQNNQFNIYYVLKIN